MITHLLWFERYGCLGVETFHSLKDACEFGEDMESAGDGVVRWIEEIGQGIVSEAVLFDIRAEWQREKDAEEEGIRPPTHQVCIKDPKNGRIVAHFLGTEEEARTEAETLAPLGDRVEVKRWPRG